MAAMEGKANRLGTRERSWRKQEIYLLKPCVPIFPEMIC